MWHYYAFYPDVSSCICGAVSLYHTCKALAGLVESDYITVCVHLSSNHMWYGVMPRYPILLTYEYLGWCSLSTDWFSVVFPCSHGHKRFSITQWRNIETACMVWCPVTLQGNTDTAHVVWRPVSLCKKLFYSPCGVVSGYSPYARKHGYIPLCFELSLYMWKLLRCHCQMFSPKMKAPAVKVEGFLES